MSLVRTRKKTLFPCVSEEVETEAMAAADLIPEAEAITAPETTIIAGKGSASPGACGEAVVGVKPAEKQLSSCKSRCCLSRRSQGGYGERNSGGSYRDSYDSYGKSRFDRER